MAEDTRPREAQALLAIAETLAGQLDLPDAAPDLSAPGTLHRGDTVSVHVRDSRHTQLIPTVPLAALPVLAGEALPVDEQGFRDSVLAGEVARRRPGPARRGTPNLPPILDIRKSSASEPG